MEIASHVEGKMDNKASIYLHFDLHGFYFPRRVAPRSYMILNLPQRNTKPLCYTVTPYYDLREATSWYIDSYWKTSNNTLNLLDGLPASKSQMKGIIQEIPTTPVDSPSPNFPEGGNPAQSPLIGSSYAEIDSKWDDNLRKVKVN